MKKGWRFRGNRARNTELRRQDFSFRLKQFYRNTNYVITNIVLYLVRNFNFFYLGLCFLVILVYWLKPLFLYILGIPIKIWFWKMNSKFFLTKYDRDVLRTLSRSAVELSFEISQRLFTVNYFPKKLHHRCLTES